MVDLPVPDGEDNMNNSPLRFKSLIKTPLSLSALYTRTVKTRLPAKGKRPFYNLPYPADIPVLHGETK